MEHAATILVAMSVSSAGWTAWLPVPRLRTGRSASGRLKGIGLTMEAIEQNPVIYELMMEHTWRNDPDRSGQIGCVYLCP